jgi:hypothetical protein
VSLQRFNEGGQKGDQPFGTDLTGGVPCLIEGVLDLWSVVNGTRMRDARPCFCGMIEEPHGICADRAGQSNKRIEQEHFLRARHFSIRRSHALNQLAPGLIT